MSLSKKKTTNKQTKKTTTEHQQFGAWERVPQAGQKVPTLPKVFHGIHGDTSSVPHPFTSWNRGLESSTLPTLCYKVFTHEWNIYIYI